MSTSTPEVRTETLARGRRRSSLRQGPHWSRTPRPNLFLIGAMKSGTSYLSALLSAHPEVFMSSPREPCHFVDPRVLRKAWPRAWQNGYWRSEERYLALFAAAGRCKVIAEGSTTYSKAPMFSGVPERILEFNPQARFLYIMRDPVERTISHYWHRVRWWGERRSILDALRADPQYRQVSHYAAQLAPYLEAGRENVHVLTLEALLADRARELRSLYGWLGIDAGFRPVLSGDVFNSMPESIEQVRGLGLLQRLRESATYARIAVAVPKPVREFLAARAVRPVRPAAVPTAAVRSYLRPIQQRETADLTRLLGRAFPEWVTLYGAD